MFEIIEMTKQIGYVVYVPLFKIKKSSFCDRQYGSITKYLV